MKVPAGKGMFQRGMIATWDVPATENSRCTIFYGGAIHDDPHSNEPG